MAPAAEGRHYRPERREPRRKVPVVRDTHDHAAPGAALRSTADTGCWRRRGPPGRLPPPPPAPWRRWPPREQAGTCRYPPRQSRTPSRPRHQRQRSAPPAARQAPPLAPQPPGTAHRPYRECVPSRAPATSRPVTVIAATRRSFSMPAGLGRRAPSPWTASPQTDAALSRSRPADTRDRPGPGHGLSWGPASYPSAPV